MTFEDIWRLTDDIRYTKEHIKWILAILNEDLTKKDYDYWLDSLCYWVKSLREDEKKFEKWKKSHDKKKIKTT